MGFVLCFNDTCAFNLGRQRLGRDALCAYHVSGFDYGTGTTIATMQGSESGATRALSAGIGASRHAALCAYHRWSIARGGGFGGVRSRRLLCGRRVLLARDDGITGAL